MAQLEKKLERVWYNPWNVWRNPRTRARKNWKRVVSFLELGLENWKKRVVQSLERVAQSLELGLDNYGSDWTLLKW